MLNNTPCSGENLTDVVSEKRDDIAHSDTTPPSGIELQVMLHLLKDLFTITMESERRPLVLITYVGSKNPRAY